MKLRPLAANMNEVEIGDTLVLFSYKTPVAVRLDIGFFKTDKQWSPTTSRHINKWFRSFGMTDAEIKAVPTISQGKLENYCD